MRILLAVSLAFATPSIAADFRGTEFGSACAAIMERETALGSELLSIRGSKVIGYHFMGRAFDRDARITYLCKDGVLALGDLHFHVDTYDEAVPFYVAAYEFYLSIYGQPFVSFVAAGKKHADFVLPAAGAPAHDLYYASWNAQDLRVHVDLVSQDRWLHDAGQNWLVVIVTTAADE